MDLSKATLRMLTAFDEMDSQQKELAHEIQRMRVAVLRAQYKLAVRLYGVRNQVGVDGANAFDLLAKALGESTEGLFDLESIAKEFSPEAFEALCGRKFANGGLLSIEHLVVLARVPTHPQRTIRAVALAPPARQAREGRGDTQDRTPASWSSNPAAGDIDVT
jgi:hypothetical protein